MIGTLKDARYSVEDRLATERMNPGEDMEFLLRIRFFSGRWTDVLAVWLKWKIPSLMTDHLRGITPVYRFSREKRCTDSNFGLDVTRVAVKHT